MGGGRCKSSCVGDPRQVAAGATNETYLREAGDCFCPDSHPSTLGTPGQGNLKLTELPSNRDLKTFPFCLQLGQAVPQVLATDPKAELLTKISWLSVFIIIMCFFQEANIFEGNYKKLIEFSNASIEAEQNTSMKEFWRIYVMHLDLVLY